MPRTRLSWFFFLYKRLCCFFKNILHAWMCQRKSIMAKVEVGERGQFRKIHAGFERAVGSSRATVLLSLLFSDFFFFFFYRSLSFFLKLQPLCLVFFFLHSASSIHFFFFSNISCFIWPSCVWISIGWRLHHKLAKQQLLKFKTSWMIVFLLSLVFLQGPGSCWWAFRNTKNFPLKR